MPKSNIKGAGSRATLDSEHISELANALETRERQLRPEVNKWYLLTMVSAWSGLSPQEHAVVSEEADRRFERLKEQALEIAAAEKGTLAGNAFPPVTDTINELKSELELRDAYTSAILKMSPAINPAAALAISSAQMQTSSKMVGRATETVIACLETGVPPQLAPILFKGAMVINDANSSELAKLAGEIGDPEARLKAMETEIAIYNLALATSAAILNTESCSLSPEEMDRIYRVQDTLFERVFDGVGRVELAAKDPHLSEFFRRQSLGDVYSLVVKMFEFFSGTDSDTPEIKIGTPKLPEYMKKLKKLKERFAEYKCPCAANVTNHILARIQEGKQSPEELYRDVSELLRLSSSVAKEITDAIPPDLALMLLREVDKHERSDG